MPRSPRTPSYCHHRASGRAYCWIGGKRLYLGEFNSPASRERFQSLVTDLIATRAAMPRDSACPLIGELILDWWQDVAPGYSASARAGARVALEVLSKHFANQPADQLGPREMVTIQRAMIARGWCRTTINDRAGLIKRLIRWAVAQGLLQREVLLGLEAVQGLRAHRSPAPEGAGVRPVSDWLLDQTLPHLHPTVQDMVRVQRLTGMRPGEVCQLAPCHLDTSGQAWTFTVPQHKGSWRGSERKVSIGPRAQAILQPHLSRCTSTRDVLFCSSAAPRRKRSGGRTPYTQASYRRAVHRACERAFPAFLCWSAETAEAFRLDHQWSPNQLRHLRATELRRTMGLEAAGAVLGHKKLTTSQIYAERDERLAVQAALQTG